jgi:hypothetical protein
MSLRAIIIDDEEFARKNLQILLEEHCPNVDVVANADGKNEALEKIKELQPDVLFLDIRMLTQKGKYAQANRTVEKIEKGLNSLGESISSIRRAFLWFKISTIRLANQEPQLALKAVRKILNDTELDKKEDIVSFTHLLELFIHIELGDLDYLNYAARATKRFLISRKRLFKFEEELLIFVSKYTSKTNKFDQIERWESLHKSLTKLAQDPYQASGLTYFDFVSWSESKMKNMSFIELSRNKFLKKRNAA